MRQRRFKNIRLNGKVVAELDDRPPAGKKSDRKIVVKKYLGVTQGQSPLFHDDRCIFSLANDRRHAATEIVLLANDRCDRENLHAQWKGGGRALHAPVDNRVSNWADMVMTSLACNPRAWPALHLPQPKDEHSTSQRTEKQRVLRMEFKTFLNAFMRFPCHFVPASRHLIDRRLDWSAWSGVFFCLVDRLHG